MNRGELVAAVKSYLNRPNLADADVATMIAAVEGELNRELLHHPRNHRRTTWVIPTVDDSGAPYTDSVTSEIPLPVDCARVRTLANASVQFPQYPSAVVPSIGYIERGDALWVYPAQSRGTTMHLDYVAFIRPLQASEDTNWVSTYYSDLYLYGALKEASVFLKDDARLAQWQTEFLRRLEGVRKQGWWQNMADAPRTRSA